MTGEDFISLAAKLSASTGEAERRTSVSRAYYGAFHMALAMLESCQIQIASGDNPHKRLYQCLDNSGDNDLRLIADKLNTLRRIRNDADYDLLSSHLTNTRNVQRHLQSAIATVDAIRNCNQRIAVLRQRLRQEARALGVLVSGQD